MKRFDIRKVRKLAARERYGELYFHWREAERMIEKKGVSLANLRTSAYDEVTRVWEGDELSHLELRNFSRALKLVEEF